MSLFDRMRTQKVLSFTLILFTLSVGIVLGTLVNQGVKAAKDDRPVVAPGASALVIPSPVELSTAFSQIAKQMEPSVVNISTTSQGEAAPQMGESPFGKGDPHEFWEPFERFFGRLFGCFLPTAEIVLGA